MHDTLRAPERVSPDRPVTDVPESDRIPPWFRRLPPRGRPVTSGVHVSVSGRRRGRFFEREAAQLTAEAVP